MPAEGNRSDVTLLLRQMTDGSRSAPDRLLELVYDDLRRLAAAYMQNERPDHTLQATALVHEAYVRLVDWKNVTWENRAQFFAVAAQVMRKVLIDHARARNTRKRASQRLVLDEAISIPDDKQVDLIALEDALIALEKIDPRQAKIVELRFFGGLSIEETAYVMELGESTVRREWTFAKAWFQRELRRDAAN
ncbi:MAG: sigma-70 family RNA polymerase sigma factor [Acidobacteriota bacterium]|nr:MAG: sigma-70 family RNA polymerase sigma factor [Acidobacteriota bacterium]